MLAPLDARERFAAAELARADLYFFARWLFAERRGYAWQRAPHHRLICEALMRVYRGECRRLIINVPPRYSKTELAVVSFVAWALGKAPDSEFIHVSYAAGLAANNSAAVRGVLAHESYRETFPGTLLADEARAHWTTTAGGVMYAAGTGGTITGFGAGKHRPGFGGAILIDDPHKADEARSDKVREGVIDWFQNTLESRKNSPETPIVLIMQRLHEKDLAGWLLGDRGENMRGPAVPGGNGEVWEHLCLSAWADERETVPLWAEKHSADELRRMEKAAPYTFAGQYRQRPFPPSGAVFEPGAIQTIDAIPAGRIAWARGWDFADSLRGDFTVGGKLGRLSDGRYLIAGIERERYLTDKRDELIRNTAARDGRGVRISIPQDPGQAGVGQARAITRMLAGYTVHSSLESGDKVTRADAFASQVNVGNVLMLRGGWNEPLIEELRAFPGGAFDDQVDALSRAFNDLQGVPDPSPAGATIQGL